MKAALPSTVALTPFSSVGIWPNAKSGALLQSTPVPTLDGARLDPLISSQPFWAMVGNPPAVSIEVMVGVPPPDNGASIVVTPVWLTAPAEEMLTGTWPPIPAGTVAVI